MSAPRLAPVTIFGALWFAIEHDPEDPRTRSFIRSLCILPQGVDGTSPSRSGTSLAVKFMGVHGEPNETAATDSFPSTVELSFFERDSDDEISPGAPTQPRAFTLLDADAIGRVLTTIE